MLHVVILWPLVCRAAPRELMKAALESPKIDVINMPHRVGMRRLHSRIVVHRLRLQFQAY
jgi:hypothetical protein